MADETVISDAAVETPVVAQVTPETPTSETEESQRFTKREIRRNMLFVIMMDAIATTGWADFSIAITPLFVFLRASNTMIGLINATAIGLVGTVLSPWITRKFRFKKWYMTAINVPTIGLIGVAGSVIVFSDHLNVSYQWLTMFVLAMLLGRHFLGGFAALPHQEYVAACIPMSHRGRMSGYSYSIAGVTSIGAIALGWWILYHYPKPMAFGYLFIITWAVTQFGYTFALFAKERPSPVESAPKAWSKAMLKAAWDDKPFFRFMLLNAVMNTCVFSVLGFVTVYGFRDLRMPAEASATIALIVQIVRVPAATLSGLLTDKFGAKRTLPWLPLFVIAQFLPVILMRNAYGVYLSVFIWTLGGTVFNTAYTVLMYGLPKPENRAGHYTLQMLMQNATVSLGALLAGIMCDVMPYMTIFIATSVLCLVFYPLVKWVTASMSDDIKAYS